MYKFFVEPDQIQNDIVKITGTDVNHIKNVLRFKVGKEVMVSDGQGYDYICEINSFEEMAVSLKLLSKGKSSTELPVIIDLFQGMPKKDKLELVIQKAVELGVAEITPVMMKRSIVKINDQSKKKKVVRWQSIADAAAKQAKRNVQPKVNEPKSLNEMKASLMAYDLLLVPYENADGMTHTRRVLSEVKKCDRIGVIIGPEGGFDTEEIEFLKSMNAEIISLGRRILRTETAGLAVLSYLMIDMEET